MRNFLWINSRIIIFICCWPCLPVQKKKATLGTMCLKTGSHYSSKGPADEGNSGRGFREEWEGLNERWRRCRKRVTAGPATCRLASFTAPPSTPAEPRRLGSLSATSAAHRSSTQPAVHASLCPSSLSFSPDLCRHTTPLAVQT